MARVMIVLITFLTLFISPSVSPQDFSSLTIMPLVSAQSYSMLDPRPYDPAVDPNSDLFISSWQQATPYQLYGSLTVQDILTPCDGDPIHPKAKGAVLTNFKRFAHGTLSPGASTKPSKLSGEQIVFYIASGKGTIKAGKKTADLHDGVGVLLPPGIEFTMRNTGDIPLTMYIISEPVPSGFKPEKEMLVHDEHSMPLDSTNGHWCHIFTRLFMQEDGLATIVGMGSVWFDPMTMGQPHSHSEGVEEIWFVLEGDVNLLLGKHMMKLSPGSAYKIPSTGVSVHSNINVTDKPVKLFWFMKIPPTTTYPDYSMLAPEPFDPVKDVNIDMFMGSYLESSPHHTHGSLLERDILTLGDPMNPPSRAAVLSFVNRFTHATLMPNNATLPVVLKGEQEIFFIISGKGVISAGTKTANLSPGITVLMPANLEFTMKNTGDEPLTMYLAAEPYPEGFRLNTEMTVVDESTQPIAPSSGHWHGDVRMLLTTADGLGTLESILTCEFHPMDFFHPHSHFKGTEEVWTTINDEIHVLLGKKPRLQPAGTAYLIPPDGKTPHANFNVSDKPVKMFYFARYRDHEVRK